MKLFAKRLRWGQAVLEYAILLAIVSAAFAAMIFYVRRAVDGKLIRIDERIVARNNQTVDAPTPPGGHY
ncbi:MAG: hypothetical protein HZB36_03510 [Candidatus Omnitrophica bacterium]|nr:hypothetical protein [Candidatus Omnitrophota bacterium]